MGGIQRMLTCVIDFSCSLDHVKNAGRIIINDERPPPAFFNLPIGYQGRAGSIVVSGTDIQRPAGQYRDRTAKDVPEGSQPPVVYGPSAACDYEMEFAAIIGKPLPMNSPINATDVDEHIFGFALLNDWSGTCFLAPQSVVRRQSVWMRWTGISANTGLQLETSKGLR